MKKIVLVGGGSGGHFYPLIAIAERLNKSRAQGLAVELFYFGPNQYDKEALHTNNVRFVRCPAGKLRKYFSLMNFIDPLKIILGFFVAIVKLYLIYPDVVFSKGSYTSVPVTAAAFLLRIPVVIHESDAKPGSANKFAALFARYIAVSFDEVAEYFPREKVALTGIPTRQIFFEAAADPLAQLGVPEDKPFIFATGGSLGAVRLNNLVLESLDELLPQYTILHQVGASHESQMQKTAASLISDSTLLERYFVRGTLSASEMHLALSGASLVISRAGTGTIYEIARAGKPAILIPIPEAVSHDQTANAYAYARSGGASVLEEKNLTDGLLASEISRIMNDPEEYRAMSEAADAFVKGDAARQIAQTLIGIAQEHASD